MSHFARSSLIIAVFFGLDKIFGFVRALIVNRQFGLTYELDVFNAANNIPDLLSALISGGALGVALIPVLSEFIERDGRSAAWDLFSRIINFAFIVTGLIAVGIVLCAPWLVENVIAPGFPPGQKDLAIQLMRLDLFAILIFSISGLVMAGLQANQHFILPALAPSLYNIGQIFGAVILAPQEGTTLGPITLPGLGLGIHGLVYGVIIGAALHLGIQLPGLLRYHFRWTPRIGFRHTGVRQVLRLLAPRVITMLFIQFFFLVRDNLASGMGEGAVTALNLGWFIMQVPETLLGTAIAIALLPTIAEIFARGERENFRQSINGAARAVLALTFPAAILLAVGIRPLAQAAFGFDPADTEMVVIATRFYLIGLTGHALLEIASRSFYAQQDATTPLIAAAINARVYFTLAILLSKHFGFWGIALANSIAFTSEALFLLWLLDRRFPGIINIHKTLLRVFLSSGFVAAILYFTLHLEFTASLNTLLNAVVTAGAMLVGLAAIVPFIMPEIRLLIRLGGKGSNYLQGNS
ncbi:MAG: murein biosynthesis integral membrane protein MurJ [Anaerolineales bacterium]|jgi:putative peptidoglycan lipid II flippase